MNQFERSDKSMEERENVWITIDVKSLPSTTVSALAAYTEDPNVLDILADFPDYSIKIQVAHNLNTLGKTLKRLAREELEFIKEMVAEHTNTFSETLEDLTKDDDERVRFAATSNIRTPEKALILRLFDPCRDVVIAAIRNPMTPLENVKRLMGGKDFLIEYEIQKRIKLEAVNSENKL